MLVLRILIPSKWRGLRGFEERLREGPQEGEALAEVLDAVAQHDADLACWTRVACVAEVLLARGNALFFLFIFFFYIDTGQKGLRRDAMRCDAMRGSVD